MQIPHKNTALIIVVPMCVCVYSMNLQSNNVPVYVHSFVPAFPISSALSSIISCVCYRFMCDDSVVKTSCNYCSHNTCTSTCNYCMGTCTVMYAQQQYTVLRRVIDALLACQQLRSFDLCCIIYPWLAGYIHIIASSILGYLFAMQLHNCVHVCTYHFLRIL